ncbi:hypothetical protein N7457_004408 [Penicillium paradoxum]|uniref:uncharacterized protein n=1 Tax=Penicillium paradoxum TaxID=176176 RepID=UPI002548B5D4|nr:uncharacterized protein N7457_004408 [Penicillium paradoxum]KAJ5782634.1 hypothetical protein N7457_004408 [Penicillium paradoxum]
MADNPSQVGKDADLQSPPGSPSSSTIPPNPFEGTVMDQEILIQFKDLFDAAPDMQAGSSTPPAFEKEMGELVHKLREMSENKTKVFEYILKDKSLREDQDETISLVYSAEINYFLLPASEYIALGKPDKAWETVTFAMKLAKESGNELLIGRCEYWMGRVEFLRGSFTAAHKHFLRAQVCAVDPEKGIECQELDFYLDITRPGITDYTRLVRLRAYDKILTTRYEKKVRGTDNIPIERKRKRPLLTWRDAFFDLQRPSIKQRAIHKIRKPCRPGQVVTRVSETQLTQELERYQNPANLFIGKVLAEELGYSSGEDFDDDAATESSDESDAEISCSAHSLHGTDGTVDEDTAGSSKPLSNAQKSTLSTVLSKPPGHQVAPHMTDSDLATAQYMVARSIAKLIPELQEIPKEPFVFGEPHEPSKYMDFRFRCFKVGLEPRGRSMTLFSKLPGEMVISTEEWKAMEPHARQQIVTWEYLMKVRYEMMRVAEQM